MARKKCAYEDCPRQEHTAGVCQDHYLEEYRIEATYDVDDFWNFVKKELRIRG
jgi:hypothetical protein